MKKREEKIIRTIYHKKVDDFFKSIGLFEKLERGEIQCNICSEIITIINFRAVTRKKSDLFFCCNKELCMQKFRT